MVNVYDASGRVVSQTDASGRVTGFSYQSGDASSRKTVVTFGSTDPAQPAPVGVRQREDYYATTGVEGQFHKDQLIKQTWGPQGAPRGPSHRRFSG